jgi:predicted dehydrogenase
MGIWGLGRGLSFYKAARQLNIDVVAGCDFVPELREQFLENAPGAQVTADAEEFLSWDFDAVVLATYCPAHADDAIRALQAGKHVLSEVTSFHTMDEGVRLVEAVEQSDRVYQLAENYPFTKPNMYLKRLWDRGVFGDLQYAEYEYVHEILWLAYTYNALGYMPVEPGWSVHSWRSWIDWHYYNTHSLGPMMHITGRRPVQVTALKQDVRLPGHLPEPTSGMAGVTPSLIRMDNGAVVRNLMGSTSADSHTQRIWGRKGFAEQHHGKLTLHMGGYGKAPGVEVTPSWDELSDLAASTGHGGGDFWVLYYFAREVLTGEPGPWEIYKASDCTIPGLLAYRSSRENGQPYDVPDFREPAQRERWRGDTFACPRYDTQTGPFPADADRSLTQTFAKTARDLVLCGYPWRTVRDAHGLLADIVDAGPLVESAEKACNQADPLVAAARQARKLIDAWPDSDGAKILRELLEAVDEQRVTAGGFADELAAIRRDIQARA